MKVHGIRRSNIALSETNDFCKIRIPRKRNYDIAIGYYHSLQEIDQINEVEDDLDENTQIAFSLLYENGHRYSSRARFLIRSKWISMKFDTLIIEYSLVKNEVAAFYSINGGMEYLESARVVLPRRRKAKTIALMEFFADTEAKFLIDTRVHHTKTEKPQS